MHPLQAEIAALRRRARSLGYLQGVCRFAAVALAAALAWLVADYAFRFQEHGIRVLGLVAVLGVTAGAALKHLAPLAAWRLSDIDVARLVDDRVPALSHRAASALEFLPVATASPTAASGVNVAGSPRLRESVVAKASAALDDVNLVEVLDYRPTIKAAAAAIAVLALGAALFAASPDEARLAINRFADPAGDLPWPPRHELAFDPPIDHLAQGDAFEIRVVERGGDLPNEVWIEYADAATPDESTEPPALDAADSRVAMQRVGAAMTARRENVRASFWYRATGGDDTAMSWRRLTVVDSPQLAACNITVHPPAYTAWPAAASPRAIRALVDSRIAIQATANRPLAEAAVVLESGQRVLLAIDATGLVVSLAAAAQVAWTIDDSRSYKLELTARDGTRSRAADERWEIQPIVDLPPVVTIEQPPAVLFATPQGRVRLRVGASDDLAVARVSLVRREHRAGETPRSPDVAAPGEQAFDLFTAPAATPEATRAAEHPLARWPRDHRVGPFDAEWNLAPLGVAPGDTIEYEAVAVDLKQTETRSPPQRILVVSREEFLERAMDQQAQIAEQLLRAIDLARQSQRALAELNARARQSGSLAEGDADALRAVETEHRQLVRILVEPAVGVAPLCEALLADLSANGVELPDRNRRVEQIRTEVRRLERDDFSPFDRELADVWTQTRSKQPSAAALAASLSAAIARHDRIVATLAALHESLAHWDNVRRVSREIAEIRRIEQGLASRSIELARTTLGVRIDDLPADTRAELGQLVESQRDLARRLDRAHARLEKLLSTLADDPHATGIVTDALAFLAANPIAGHLASAADQIAANQLAQAAQTQAQAIDLLGELIALLDNRPETDPERQSERLAAAAARLERLRAEFSRLAAELRDAAAIADTPRRNATLAERDAAAQSLARELAQLSREAVRFEALRAAERIARSAAALRDISKSVAERPESATEASQAVEADLAAAARLLAAHAREIRARRIREQLAALVATATGLLHRQEMLLAESKAFQQFAASATADAWQSATADAIGRQNALALETAQLAEFTTVDAFAVQLSAAAEEMAEAATKLGASRTLAQSTDLQRLVVDRLRQTIAAAAPPTEPPPDAPQPSPQTPDADPPASPPGPVHVVEELRLVRAMQAALNERTAGHHARRGSAAPSDEDQRQLVALAAEQQRIADLLRKLFVDANHPAITEPPSDDIHQQPPPTDDAPSPLGP